MKKFKQLKHESDLEGKIITRVITSDRELVIHFINDEFCIFKVDGYEESYIEIEIQDSDRPSQPSAYNLYDLKHQGFISESEYNELYNKFQLDAKQNQDAKDRALYESLKKKYGN